MQGAADVGAGHQSGTSAAEVIGLDPPELSGFIGLHQVVDPGTAAADARFRCFPELDLRDGSQQLAGLGLDALAVNHVAGVVHGHNAAEGLQLAAEGLREAAIGEKFLHVQHRCSELKTSCQEFAVGLHRVAAAGGCHQHRIQIPFNTVHALHQVRGQLAGQLQLPLVMTHGATATLIRRNHHLKTVGLQHLHRGVAHIWIEAALHAAQQQGNAAAAFTRRRIDRWQGVAEAFGSQRWQQLLHGLDFRTKEPGESGATGQALQRCAGIGPQRLQQGPQPPGIGQHLQQQLAETDLPAAAVLELVEFWPSCLNQLVVTHA